MNNPEKIKSLLCLLHLKGSATITVKGTSMEPTLYPGDIVTIERSRSYNIGDILVFTYKTEGLLIHRLLKKESLFYCKGDNSFRLEDISSHNVIGKVIQVNSKPVTSWRNWQTDLSYAVSRQFLRCLYDKHKTMQTDIYKLYKELVLQDTNNSIFFSTKYDVQDISKNDILFELLHPDNSSTSYSSHDLCQDILNMLQFPCNLDTLVERLCTKYSDLPENIRSDVKAILAVIVPQNLVEIRSV